MAAAFSVKIKCAVCEHETTITDTDEAAKGSIGTKEPRYQCARCKVIFPITFSVIALTHSGDVGANDTLTHTMASPGSIASAVS